MHFNMMRKWLIMEFGFGGGNVYLSRSALKNGKIVKLQQILL